MSRNLKLVAALVVAFAAQGAMAGVDFNGYLRSGSGSNNKGGKEACFRLNGDSALTNGASGTSSGRLGNECDTYGEIALGTTMGEAEGTKFGVHTLLAYGAQQNQDYEQSVPAFRESYATAQGFGKGMFEKSTVWVGKRYYNRKDTHIVDMFWLEVAGPGAGIENIDLGVGKFSYALMRAGDSSFNGAVTGVSQDPITKNITVTTENQGLLRSTDIGNPGAQKMNHDLRFEGINLGAAGSLGFGTNIIRSNNTAATDAAGGKKDGWSAWVTQSKVFGPIQNGLTFQIARDAGSLNGAGLWWAGSSLTVHNAWRVLDVANFEFGQWNGQAYVGYGKEEFPWQTTRTSTQIVARPVYHFNDLYSIAVEGGRSSVSGTGVQAGNAGNGTNYLYKLTVAPQLSMGSGFFARPVLRAYYTYARWNQGGGNVCTGRDCQVTAPAFANATSGSSFGVQMEAWW